MTRTPRIATVALVLAFLIACLAVGLAFHVSAVQRNENTDLQARLSRVTAHLDTENAQLTTQTAELATLRKPAEAGHLGVCVAYYTFTDGLGSTNTWVSGISSPANEAGVPSCPSGSFIPVVPGG